MNRDRTTLGLALFGIFFLVFATLPALASDQPDSGSSMPPDRQKYNRLASQTNAPLLSKFCLCKALRDKKKLNGPVDETDAFSTKDKQFYFFTRWKNVIGEHRCKVTIFDPRGNLFEHREYMHNGKDRDWSIARQYYIKGASPGLTPGRWRCDIFMDDVLAGRQDFHIGNPATTYSPSMVTPGTPAVGVVRVQYNSVNADNFKRKVAIRLSEHISQMLVADYPRYRVVLPWLIHQKFELSSDMNLKDDLDGVMRSPLLENVIKANGIRVLIMGSANLDVLDRFKSLRRGESAFIDTTLYVIDAADKRLLETVQVSHMGYRSDYKADKDEFILGISRAVYKNVIKKAGAAIEQTIEKGPAAPSAPQSIRLN